MTTASEKIGEFIVVYRPMLSGSVFAVTVAASNREQAIDALITRWVDDSNQMVQLLAISHAQITHLEDMPRIRGGWSLCQITQEKEDPTAYRIHDDRPWRAWPTPATRYQHPNDNRME